MILNKGQVETIITILKENVSFLQATYLFGSGVREDFNDESDVDIAFISDKIYPKEDIWTVASKIADVVKRDVDLVDLMDANTVHQMEIVGNGVLLFHESTFDYGEMEDKIYQLYITLNEDRKVILDGIKEDQSVYG